MTLQVAIIGSGPAGFYTAYRLLQKVPNISISLFESLPIPFGLSRFGVAPDHPEVKNCQDKFNEVANLNPKKFQYYGNVKIGKDLSLKDLYNNYNSIFFTYGTSYKQSKKISNDLSDPLNENLNGIYSSKDFVNWYNGHPFFRNLNPPLKDSKKITILGNGNVAIDIARILLMPIDLLKKTDITDYALESLANSSIEEVNIIGRRGLLQSSFTNKELRELFDLEKYGISNKINAQHFNDKKPFISKFERSHQRLLKMIDDYSLPYSERSKTKGLKPPFKPLNGKKWTLEYLYSPIKFFPSLSNDKLISSIKLEINKLKVESSSSNSKENVKCIGTGEYISWPADLAIKSIGYKALPLNGFEELNIPFDFKNNKIPNINGKILKNEYNEKEIKDDNDNDNENDKFIKGLYAAGWIKNGPNGVIATTMLDSFNTAEIFIKDLETGFINSNELKNGFNGIKNKIKSNKIISWNDWLKIDKLEIENGLKKGKYREKFTNIDEILNILG